MGIIVLPRYSTRVFGASVLRGGSGGGGGGGSVALNTPGTGTSFASGTSFSYTGLTVGSGSNRGMIVCVTFNANVSAITLTWDSGGTNQAMEQIISQKQDQWTVYIYWFGLVNPTPGNKTLAGSWTTATTGDIVSADFTGVNQTGSTTTWANALGASGFDTSPAVTITTASNHLAIAGTTNDLTNVTARSHTQLVDYTSSQPNIYSQYTTSGSAAFTWTCSGSTHWGAAGFDIVPA